MTKKKFLKVNSKLPQLCHYIETDYTWGATITTSVVLVTGMARPANPIPGMTEYLVKGVDHFGREFMYLLLANNKKFAELIVINEH